MLSGQSRYHHFSSHLHPKAQRQQVLQELFAEPEQLHTPQEFICTLGDHGQQGQQEGLPSPTFQRVFILEQKDGSPPRCSLGSAPRAASHRSPSRPLQRRQSALPAPRVESGLPGNLPSAEL